MRIAERPRRRVRRPRRTVPAERYAAPGRRGRRPLRGLHQCNAPVFRNVRVVWSSTPTGGMRITERSRRRVRRPRRTVPAEQYAAPGRRGRRPLRGYANHRPTPPWGAASSTHRASGTIRRTGSSRTPTPTGVCGSRNAPHGVMRIAGRWRRWVRFGGRARSSFFIRTGCFSAGSFRGGCPVPRRGFRASESGRSPPPACRRAPSPRR